MSSSFKKVNGLMFVGFDPINFEDQEKFTHEDEQDLTSTEQLRTR